MDNNSLLTIVNRKQKGNVAYGITLANRLFSKIAYRLLMCYLVIWLTNKTDPLLDFCFMYFKACPQTSIFF